MYKTIATMADEVVFELLHNEMIDMLSNRLETEESVRTDHI